MEPNHHFGIFALPNQENEISIIFKLNKVIRWELCTMIDPNGHDHLAIAIEWELLE